MSASFNEIEQQAQRLTASERAQLAEAMLASLEAPVSEVESAWIEEIEARAAAFDAGDMKAVSAAEVLAEARSLGH